MLMTAGVEDWSIGVTLDRETMHGKLMGICKEAVVPCFHISTQYAPCETEEQEDRHRSDRKSKQVSPEYTCSALRQLPTRAAEPLAPFNPFHFIVAAKRCA
jgi:hypothetical protein